MKAIWFEKYGSPDQLQFVDIEKPACKPHDVLVKLKSANITKGDCELRSFSFPFWIWLPLRVVMGIFKPKRKVLGSYFSGSVEAIGEDVKEYQIGDDVYGISGFNFGCYAEYLTHSLKDKNAVLTRKPNEMTWEEAASIGLGGIESLHFLKFAKLAKNRDILINGAGGSIGTCAIQLAKYHGLNVTVVDTSEKFEMMEKAGADTFLDYQVNEIFADNIKYDIVLDVVGNLKTSNVFKSLNENGVFLESNPKFSHLLFAWLYNIVGSKKVIINFAEHKKEYLEELNDLYKKEAIRPIVSKVFKLEEVKVAHELIERGKKEGNYCIVF